MALRYAVANGNWSNTATWNGGTLPTSADDVYSNNFTVTIDQNITVLTLRNVASSPAVAGGGFIVNDGVTIACTATLGIVGAAVGGSVLITYSGTGSSVINSNITGNTTNGTPTTLIHNGIGTLTINGKVSINAAQTVISHSGGGILNINGDINNGPNTSASNTNANALAISGTSVVNVVGNVYGCVGTFGVGINATSGTPTINITGLVSTTTQSSTSYQAVILNTGATCNIVGNVVNNWSSGTATITVGSASAVLQITGNVSNSNSLPAISCTVNAYIKIIGIITSSNTAVAVVSTGTGAINIFSGPFVSSPYGVFPFQVFRMHLIPSASSYLEFRDNSTNGALSPGAIAPATRLVSPATVVDAPATNNVRDGIVYALGSQTGTLKVPNPNQVAVGVPTDNTVGTAVLRPQDVWDHLLANITTPNSIGNRLKQAATVESTGDQLASLT